MIYHVFQELIEKLSKNELPKSDYPCMNDPSPTFHGRTQSEPAKAVEPHAAAHSMRSRRTATWARPRDSEDGYSRYSCHFYYDSPLKYILFIFPFVAVIPF